MVTTYWPQLDPIRHEEKNNQAINGKKIEIMKLILPGRFQVSQAEKEGSRWKTLAVADDVCIWALKDGRIWWGSGVVQEQLGVEG